MAATDWMAPTCGRIDAPVRTMYRNLATAHLHADDDGRWYIKTKEDVPTRGMVTVTDSRAETLRLAMAAADEAYAVTLRADLDAITRALAR